MTARFGIEEIGSPDGRPDSWNQEGVFVEKLNRSGDYGQLCETLRLTNLENNFVEFLLTVQRAWPDGTIINERPKSRLIHLLRGQGIRLDGNPPRIGPQIYLATLRRFYFAPTNGELQKGRDYELYGERGKDRRALKVQLKMVNHAVIMTEIQTSNGVVEVSAQIAGRQRRSFTEIGPNRQLLRVRAYGFNILSLE